MQRTSDVLDSPCARSRGERDFALMCGCSGNFRTYSKWQGSVGGRVLVTGPMHGDICCNRPLAAAFGGAVQVHGVRDVALSTVTALPFRLAFRPCRCMERANALHECKAV